MHEPSHEIHYGGSKIDVIIICQFFMTLLDLSVDPSDDPSHPSDVSRRSPVGFFADLYNRNGPDELVY